MTQENPPASASVDSDPALATLETRLAAAQHAEADRLSRDHAPMRDPGRSAAIQVASTMVGYPLGGIIVGGLLDSLFHTRPWIMIGLMFLAFFGACVQVVRNNKNSAG